LKYNKIGGVVPSRQKKVKGDMRISIADQGIGIPMASSMIFSKKFFRAENTLQTKEKGTGLDSISSAPPPKSSAESCGLNQCLTMAPPFSSRHPADKSHS